MTVYNYIWCLLIVCHLLLLEDGDAMKDPQEMMFTMSRCPHPVNTISLKKVATAVYNKKIIDKANISTVAINKKENDYGCKFGLRLVKPIPSDALVYIDLTTKSMTQQSQTQPLVRETWCDFIKYEKNEELYNAIFKGSTFPKFGTCPWPSGIYKQEKLNIDERQYPCSFIAELYEIRILIFTGSPMHFIGTKENKEKHWIVEMKILADVKPKALNETLAPAASMMSNMPGGMSNVPGMSNMPFGGKSG